MAQGKNTTVLTDLLLKCMSEPDPMLSMLEWLCAQLRSLALWVRKKTYIAHPAGITAVDIVPGGTASRAEVATMLMRFATLVAQ